MSPLVSICIPTYNGDRFLAEALISVEAQTYEHCEVVVSDDASSDRTLEIVEEFAARSKYEYRIFNHLPSGIGSNWNHCVEHSRGEYIKYLFQDDFLGPDCVAEMVDLIETDSSIGLVFCRRGLLISQEPSAEAVTWCYMYADPSRRWAHRLTSPVWGRELLKSRDLLYPPRNKVGEPSSVLLRRSIFETVGFFNAELKQSVDYEYWYRIFARYKVGFIPRKLNVFRVHENQATQQNKRDQLSENVVHDLVKQVDPALLHNEVLARASGCRSVFYLVFICAFHGKRIFVICMVALKLLRGRRFLPRKK